MPEKSLRVAPISRALAVEVCVASTDHRIVRVLEAIESDPNRSIDDLAQLTNLSHSRLSHLFKAETGVSLRSYLATSQLEMAAELLKSTDLRVKEVSYRAGYRHEPSFVRAFRNKFGSTPGDYRTRQRLALRDSRFD